MTADQLRQTLSELNGERSLTVAFAGVHAHATVLDINRAMLIPDEPDHLVKVTDGTAVFVIEADKIAWIRIGMNHVS